MKYFVFHQSKVTSGKLKVASVSSFRLSDFKLLTATDRREIA